MSWKPKGEMFQEGNNAHKILNTVLSIWKMMNKCCIYYDYRWRGSDAEYQLIVKDQEREIIGDLKESDFCGVGGISYISHFRDKWEEQILRQ